MRRLALSLLTGCAIAWGSQGAAHATDVLFPSWQWGEAPSPLAQLKVEFEKAYPGDTIKSVTTPYDSFFDKQYSEVSSGTPADIVTMFSPEIAQYMKKDLLVPLDKYVDASGISRDKLNPSNKLAIKDGHIYGIMLLVNPRALLMNGQMLKDAGVSVPTNVDEFLAAIKKLHNPSKQEFGFASWAASGAAGDLYLEIAPIVAGFGGQWFTDGKPTANSQEIIAALSFLQTLYKDGLVPRVNGDTSRQMFVNGKLAMNINGPYLAGFTAEQNKGTFQNLETTTLPLPAHRTTAVTVFLGIPKHAKNEEAAGRAITTLLKPEVQKYIVETYKSIPAVNGSVSQEFLSKNPWFEAFVKAADTSVSFAPQGAEEYGPEIYNIVGPAVEDILFNDKDVHQAANELQQQLEDFIAKKKAN
ncbi:sugar ABC transporter substrate-binding protein [Mesorhizobium sp. M0643]|uniref:ABC transporter substrate-binding protein n=1 Tax=Mesorhizobium sp. M0643 TaxID=2956978 RepID=UPI003339FAC6